MTLGKKTIDNSNRGISKNEQTKDRDSKPNTTLRRKQSKNISQNKKKFLINISESGLRISKRIMKCYFLLKRIQILLFSKQKQKTRNVSMKKFRMYEQMQTFSFSPPVRLSEKGKWLLTVTSFEETNSVFDITNENNSFSITIPSH